MALYYLGRYDKAIEALKEVEDEIGPMLMDKKTGGTAYSVLQRPAWYLTKAINRRNAARNT